MQQSMRFAAIQTFAVILVAGPLMSIVIAGILFGVFTVTGGQATFKQLFSVYVHSTVITAAAQLFIGPLNYFRESMSSATNLGILNLVHETSFLGRLLGMIDLFWIWWLVVLAIGLGVLYRRRTQSVALGLFGVYFVGILLVAAVMSMFGRS
jgi:Yip1 domain